MKSSRREFILKSGAAAAALGLGMSYANSSTNKKIKKAKKSLKILILGGTAFTGPHLIKYAMDRGHSISIFNRGKTKPTVHKAMFDKVEQLIGDRNDNLEALKGRQWDAVIDNYAVYPRWVRQTADILKDNVDIYLFNSTLGVAKDFSKRGINEDDPVATTDTPDLEDMSLYGPLKALSEQVTRDAFKERAIIVRPHLIVGPGDTTDRFTYWAVRVKKGGEILAPGSLNHPVQYIDARDLSKFMIHLIENRTVGTFSGVGPLAELSMAELLYGMRAVVSNDISFTWVDQKFVEKYDNIWNLFPNPWYPLGGEWDGFGSFNNSKSVKEGLTYRPLAETVKDTLTWWDTLSAERTIKTKVGIEFDEEKKILAKWKNHK
jgi:2'-hydroxyisoflavone reductase